MGSDICGNCGNFKPKPGERFFDCTSAEHAGLKYGMQVRADTRSCDAFVPLGAPSIHASAASPPPAPTPMPSGAHVPPREQLPSEEGPPSKERERPVGLCPRGRTLLVAGLVIGVLLLSWLLYTCASTMISSPAPTPTITPTPTPTPIVNYYDIGIGEWAVTSQLACKMYSPKRQAEIAIATIGTYKAPPGSKFILVSATVTNLSETPYSIKPGGFIITDSQGRTYAPYTYDFHHNKFPTRTLQEGGTVGGELLWIVPDFASGLEVSATLDPVGTPRVIAKWKLPW